MKILLTIVGLIIIAISLFLLGFLIGYVHGSAPDEKSLWWPDNYEPMDDVEPLAQKHLHLN